MLRLTVEESLKTGRGQRRKYLPHTFTRPEAATATPRLLEDGHPGQCLSKRERLRENINHRLSFCT